MTSISEIRESVKGEFWLGERKVTVSIRSRSYRGEEEPEMIEVTAAGTMQLTEECAIVLYDEALDTDMPPQQVRLEIDSEGVLVERDGPYELKLAFRERSRFESRYQTPVGPMDVAVFCTALQYDIDENGGTIYIQYQLNLNGEYNDMHEVEYTLSAEKSAGRGRKP